MSDIARAAPLVIALGLAGAGLLRRSWTGRRPNRMLILGGWLLFAVALLAAGALLGPARGLFAALAFLSVAALAVVMMGAEWRPPRDARRSLAPEPLEGPSRAWRGWVRALLAGPVGMIAAMGAAIAYAVWMPGVAQTRLVVAGLMVPVLWGGAMAWTLADQRLLRAAAVLIGIALLTFAAAALRGWA